MVVAPNGSSERPTRRKVRMRNLFNDRETARDELLSVFQNPRISAGDVVYPLYNRLLD